MSLITTLMNSVADVYRPTIGRDSAMGVTQEPFAKVNARQLPCSAQQASGTEKLIYAQRNSSVSTTVYFAEDPGCEINDRLRITNNTTGVANWYLVRSHPNSDEHAVVWEVQCEWIKSPGV